MAINKKLIHFKLKSSFETELANNNILDISIVFIQETKEIWTHGQLYKCSDPDLSNYVKESELQELLSPIQSSLANKLEVSDLAGYAKTSDIPAVVTDSTVSNGGFMKTSDANETYAPKSLVETVSNQSTTISTLATKDELSTGLSGKLDNSAASGFVPTTRTINGTALTDDIWITATDPNAATKDELNGLATTVANKADISALANFATTDALSSGLSGKQETLVSGTNIKTIEGKSILGSGDIQITAAEVGAYTTGQVDEKVTALNNAISGKVDPSTVNAVSDRVSALEGYFSTAEDSDATINKWGEIVNFLDGVAEGSNVEQLLAAKANQSALNDLSTTVSNVDAKFANYLPTSGGVVSGLVYIKTSDTNPLQIFSSSGVQSGTIWYVNDIPKSWFGYDANGTNMYDYDHNATFGIASDGVPKFNNSPLWHSGNFNPSDYLPTSGGTITGNTDALKIMRNANGYSAITYYNTQNGEATLLGVMGFDSNGEPSAYRASDNTWRTLIHSGNIGSQTVSHALTSTDARCVVADNNAVLPQGALLHSGINRLDDSTGDTWIYYDSLGGADAPGGIKHNQSDNYIEFYGAGVPKSFINLSTGDHYAKGFVNTDYWSAEYALTSNGGVAHIPSMSVNYANTAGSATDQTARNAAATAQSTADGKWTWNASDVANVKVNNAGYADSAGSATAAAEADKLAPKTAADFGANVLKYWIDWAHNTGYGNGDYSYGIYLGAPDYNYAFQFGLTAGYDNLIARVKTAGNWTDWKYLAYTSDIPTSLPANGGTADYASSATYDSNWNHIANTYATKGEIPSVGNGTITITQNGTSKGSFTLNQSGNATIELTDTNTHPDLSGYATQSWVSSNFNYSTDTWRPITDSYSGSEQGTSLSQYGANALYNALVNGYAAEAGYASSAGSANSVAWDNVSGRPSSLPANGGNADTLGGNSASDFIRFYLSPMPDSAPADSAKSWFTNTMPSHSGAIVYNVPGSEKTIIASKSANYGHMFQLNYDDNYPRLLRYEGGSWKTDDWEKISAGYADTSGYAASAGSIAWDNVTGKPTIPTNTNQLTNGAGFITSASIPSSLPANGGTATNAYNDQNGSNIVNTYATKDWVSSNFNYSTDTWRPVYDGVDSSATDTSASANAVRLAYSRADSAYSLAAGKQDAISDLSTIRSQASNGNTAYSWGNHANAGYLSTSSIVTDSGTSNVSSSAQPVEMMSFNGLIANGSVFSRNGSLYVADNPYMPASTHGLDVYSDPQSYGGVFYEGQIILDLYPDRFYDLTHNPLISGLKINSISGGDNIGIISHNIVRFKPTKGTFTLTLPSGIYGANGNPIECEDSSAIYEISFIKRSGGNEITATGTKFTQA